MWGRKPTETLQAGPRPAAIVRAADEGRTLNVLGAPYVFKATSAETGDRFCLIEHTVAPGAGVPPHTHEHEDEAFYVLAGEIVIDSADRAVPLRLAAGSFFYGPRGLQHSFRNEGEVEARMLVLCSPGSGIERMFAELDAAGHRAGGMPAMDEIAAVTARAGVVIAAEPRRHVA